jgi:hypothetical protein
MAKEMGSLLGRRALLLRALQTQQVTNNLNEKGGIRKPFCVQTRISWLA